MLRCFRGIGRVFEERWSTETKGREVIPLDHMIWIEVWANHGRCGIFKWPVSVISVSRAIHWSNLCNFLKPEKQTKSAIYAICSITAAAKNWVNSHREPSSQSRFALQLGCVEKRAELFAVFADITATYCAGKCEGWSHTDEDDECLVIRISFKAVYF